MGFLKNDGDIIVDAVLTDKGREKLSLGLKIVSQFALGDSEIDYGLYNRNNASGSAYYDLDILKTPIFEPSTFSESALGTKLFSYPSNNLLYLPVFKLNQSSKVSNGLTKIDSTNTQAINVLSTDALITTLTQTVVASDTTMIDGRRNVSTSFVGSLSANQVRSGLTSRFIRVSQGFDNAAATINLGNLEETNFSVYVNRLFLKLVDKNYQYLKEPSLVSSAFSRSQATDVYKLSVKNDPSYFGDVETYQVSNSTSLATDLAASSINQVGKEVQFSLQLSDFVANNPSYYFTTYGQSYTGAIGTSASVTATYISTVIRIVGDNYGFSVDIPIKLFYV